MSLLWYSGLERGQQGSTAGLSSNVASDNSVLSSGATFTAGRKGGLAVRTGDRKYVIPRDTNEVTYPSFIDDGRTYTMGFGMKGAGSPGSTSHAVKLQNGTSVNLDSNDGPMGLQFSSNSSLLYLWANGGTNLHNVPFAYNTWAYIEVQWRMNSGSDFIKWKVDDTLVYENNSITLPFRNTVVFGQEDGFSVSAYYDDMYILDSTGPAPLNDFLGPVVIEAHVPNGNGDSTNFTPSSGTNYECVDEAETTLALNDDVQSSTVGDRDLYTLEDQSFGNSDVLAARYVIDAQKTDSAGTIGLTLVVRTNSTDYDGSHVDLLTSNQRFDADISVNPDTGLPWTKAEIDSIQLGFKVST